MNNSRECKNCIWFDQCAEEVACDGYDPVVQEDADALSMESYKRDLQTRHDDYQGLIAEQNS